MNISKIGIVAPDRSGTDAVVKMFKLALGLMVLLGAVASDCALAHRVHTGRSGHIEHSGGAARHAHPGHGPRAGAFIAVPVFAPWFYPPFGYYGSEPLPAAPQLYIEQDPAAPGTVQQHFYWYYCADAKAYYPYVDACPGGWQAVEAEVPPPS
jgi:hypothetical protein